MNKHTIDELRQWQHLPLEVKILMTKSRIRGWVNEYGIDNVYIAFSGGKDSTVLLHIARQDYPEIKAVFVDVPTQYPELKQFAMTWDNVEVIHPDMGYIQVVEKYGFPLISKEVAECVAGARSYLTSIQDELESSRHDTTRHPYSYFYDKLCGLSKYAQSIEGGCDNKYRKLRGIGRYTQSGQGEGQHNKDGKDVGNAHDRQQDKGEYP